MTSWLGQPVSPRSLRGAFLGVACLGLMLAPGRASADDDVEVIVVPSQPTAPPPSVAPAPTAPAPAPPTAGRQVIVIVQPPAAGPPGTGAVRGAPLRVPNVGDPPFEIRAYLSQLEDDLRIKKADYKSARRSNDTEARDQARRAMEDANALYKRERDRLTEQDAGMVAGGATLVGVGGAALVVSAILAAVWALDETVDFATGANRDRSSLGHAALGCLGGGLAGVAVGIPLLVIGVQREPRTLEESYASAEAGGFRPPTAGLTARWSF